MPLSDPSEPDRPSSTRNRPSERLRLEIEILRMEADAETRKMEESGKKTGSASAREAEPDDLPSQDVTPSHDTDSPADES